ncbi:MAG: PDZ domain-containing protein [Endozoicomonas sp.]
MSLPQPTVSLGHIGSALYEFSGVDNPEDNRGFLSKLKDAFFSFFSVRELTINESKQLIKKTNDKPCQRKSLSERLITARLTNQLYCFQKHRESHQTHEVTLSREEGPLDFQIIGGVDEPHTISGGLLRTGIFVNNINEAGVGYKHGLRNGDLIFSVNEESLVNCNHEHAQKTFIQATNSIKLKVCPCNFVRDTCQPTFWSKLLF